MEAPERGKKGKEGKARNAVAQKSSGARIQFDDPSQVAKAKKAQIVKREIERSDVPFLQHLAKTSKGVSISQGTGLGGGGVHPAIQQLGVKYAEGEITGSHDGCVAFVDAIARFVADFLVTDETQDFRRELDKHLKRCVQFVVECRPMSVSMGNFVRYLKAQIAHLPPTVSEGEGRHQILEAIRSFRETRLDRPMSAIARIGGQLVVDGDKVVVFSNSEVVRALLGSAAAAGTAFSVAVVDSRPTRGAWEMASFLDQRGVAVEYGLLSGASYLVQGATKLVLGAHAIMSDGAVLSCAGTAALALLARSRSIPTLVACETIQFSERLELDSIAFNELGDPDELALPDAPAVPANMRYINLHYDVTPAEVVDAVITEVGVVPPSSVAVLLEEADLAL